MRGGGLAAPGAEEIALGVPTLSKSAHSQTCGLFSRSVEIQEVAVADIQQFVGLSQGRLRERPPETAEAAITC